MVFRRPHAAVFALGYRPASVAEVRNVLARLGRRAAGLGLRAGGPITLVGTDEVLRHEFGRRYALPGELAPLVPSAVCVFTAALPDGAAVEVGLASHGGGGWAWTGVAVTRELRRLGWLAEAAAELGVRVDVTVGRRRLVCRQGGSTNPGGGRPPSPKLASVGSTDACAGFPRPPHYTDPSRPRAAI